MNNFTVIQGKGTGTQTGTQANYFFFAGDAVPKNYAGRAHNPQRAAIMARYHHALLDVRWKDASKGAVIVTFPPEYTGGDEITPQDFPLNANWERGLLSLINTGDADARDVSELWLTLVAAANLRE